MTIELMTLPLDVKARMAAIGRQFGSVDTLAQAEDALAACDKYGSLLADHGFVANDIERLSAARQALRQLGVGSDAPVSARKQTSLRYVRALRDGKTLRLRARSILHIVMQRLADTGDGIQIEASRAVSSALEQTGSSRGDPLLLASQLDQLRAILTMARVERAVSDRGGPALVPLLVETADRLHATVREPRPSDTNPIDVIDGIIVELVRDARRASRSASRTLSRPEIAAAFELVRLSGADE